MTFEEKHTLRMDEDPDYRERYLNWYWMPWAYVNEPEADDWRKMMDAEWQKMKANFIDNGGFSLLIRDDPQQAG